MHVTRYRQDRRHRSKRPPLAAVLMFALMTAAGVAQAVGFDEKLKAPAMKSAAEFKTQAQAFATRFRDIRAATPVQLVTNTTVARQRFDLAWQVQHAIDLRQPLDVLADVGIVSRGDGSYSIDTYAYPQWFELAQSMISVVLPDFFDATAEGLLQRGFRPQDVETLRNYVATHDYNRMAAAPSLPISLGFSRTVKGYDDRKQAVPDSLVFSYWYQLARARAEAEREWADGLLKCFDAQRQRIYLSAVLELKSSSIWMPDDVASGIHEVLALVRQPDFEQRVIAEAKGVAP